MAKEIMNFALLSSITSYFEGLINEPWSLTWDWRLDFLSDGWRAVDIYRS
jgi:hypothetical protein